MNPDELSKNPVLTDWDVKVIPCTDHLTHAVASEGVREY